MSRKVYAEMAPMAVVMIVAGMRALGAFPNAAMPDDKIKKEGTERERGGGG
jgi:hypothetical protein